MRIIISPAKKMNINTDTLACRSVPVYLKEAGELLEWRRRERGGRSGGDQRVRQTGVPVRGSAFR